MEQSLIERQAEVIDYLQSPGPWPVTGKVEHIETHGAHVFLCGNVALKLKRDVLYDYLDQSTPALRHALLKRELALNAATAPMIYRDVLAVTRATDGGLCLGGTGKTVDWVLRMHRFPAGCEMLQVAACGKLTRDVASALGRTIHDFHTRCPRHHAKGDALMGEILDELERVLRPFDSMLDGTALGSFLPLARRHLDLLSTLLRDRAGRGAAEGATGGHVRRVHGDLHLRNLLLIDGQPVLFDALEFDDRLATCDVLYDLAFLVMDLCHRSLHGAANATLGAYLLAAAGSEDAGLSALPLFLSVRAAIRAMVVLQTDQATGRSGANTKEARRYLSQALHALRPASPVVIAIGGMSGTGKTVLAHTLAPRIGACPGAVHLRTDTERKPDGTGHADAAAYSPQARGAVYDRMLARAETLIRAGHSVILDATFLDPAWRAAASDMAKRWAVPFHGLWLTAHPAILIRRVTARTQDASDADAAVVAAQVKSMPARPAIDSGWTVIDAAGPPESTRAAAEAALVSCGPKPVMLRRI